MKTKFCLLWLMLGLGWACHAQTDQENLEKYWRYRDKLRKNFLRIGSEKGQSIPMTSRRVDWAFQGQNNSPWPDAGALYFSDANIYLGHYMMMLATEAKLFANQIQLEGGINGPSYVDLTAQLQETLIELYYAIQAFNRLDVNAEDYHDNKRLDNSAGSLNGYFIRDDVQKGFEDAFETDYSSIFDRGGQFLFVDGDTYAFPEYPQDANDEWPDIALDQMMNI